MAKVVFRFDIDTFKCAKISASKLAPLADQFEVKFTFFCNFGKAVDRIETIRSLIRADSRESAPHLSARQKLGLLSFLRVALLNPRNIQQSSSLAILVGQGHELGLHGGRNHAKWASCYQKWTIDQIRAEVRWGLKALMAVDPVHLKIGFSSPEWCTPEILEQILEEEGFFYLADAHGVQGKSEFLSVLKKVNTLGVNEPGGVAYFEGCFARGVSPEGAAKGLLRLIESCPEGLFVVYDHPYFAGGKGIEYLKVALSLIINAGHEVVTIRDFLSDLNETVN